MSSKTRRGGDLLIKSEAAPIYIPSHRATPDAAGPSFVHEVIDWRTLDPETIRGEDIPVEELRTYREKIDELLRDGEGAYVVIAGHEIVMYCKTLEAAAEVSRSKFGDRRPLIKKVVATEPVHTLGGVVG